MKKPTPKAQARKYQSNALILTLVSNSAQAQRDYILRTLARRSVTTQQLRDAGIMHPAGRIKELKQAGWRIVRTMETIFDRVGIKHGRVARYHLANGGAKV